MSKRKLPTELKVLFAIFGVLILSWLWIACRENTILRSVYWIGFIILVFSVGILQGPKWFHSLNMHLLNQYNKNTDNSSGIVIPAKEPIIGSFVCPSCGATTEISNEINPKTSCRFCGASLPDLQEVIETRDEYYRDMYRKEIEHQMNLREEREKNAGRLRELEAQKEIEKKRAEHAEALERINAEAERQKNQTKIDIAIFAVACVIALAVILFSR